MSWRMPIQRNDGEGRSRWMETIDVESSGSTGVVGAARAQGEVRNTGDPPARQHGHSGRGATRESEGLVVPMKRVTTVEGRSPGSDVLSKQRTRRRLA